MIQRILTAVMFLTLCAAPAMAAFVTMEVSGTFGAGVVLNGTTSLANTPFTYRAQFNPAVNTGTPPGNLISPASVEFFINNVTYTGGSSHVWLDATNPMIPAVPYTAGLSNESLADWQYFMGNYDTVSVPFNAATPQNSILSGTTVDNSTGGLTLDFAGGNTLSNLSFAADQSTVTIGGVNAVPEPSTYALFSLGLGGLALWKRRQRKA